MCRGAKAIFVEREDGRFRLRRGFTIPPGARVLMVEDIITTGLSSRETLEALAEHPGTIVGAACLINRFGGQGRNRREARGAGHARHPGLSGGRAAAGTRADSGGEAGEPRPGRAEVRVSNMTALFILYGRLT